MKRVLLKQMKNDWRENVWIVIELAVVIAAIWVILAYLYGLSYGLWEERGFTPDDVYSLTVKTIKKNSPQFVEPNDTTGQFYYDDLRGLMARLRENPNVEAVAMHSAALPYNYNFSGINVDEFGVEDSVTYMANSRWGSPDIVRVLKLKSLTGADENQLVEMLRRGEMLVSNNRAYEGQDRDPMSLKGKQVTLGRDSNRLYRVGDIIAQVRRNDYEMSYGGTIIIPMNEEKDWAWGLVLRVKPGRGMQFKEDFKTNLDLQRQRNVYLSDLRSLMDIREANQRSIDTDLRMKVVVMGFLLVTIFLGLLGSFWFRIQQRVSEIAIRKVCGATKSSVFLRIITEGMVLLALASLLSAAGIWPFLYVQSEMIGLEWYEFLIVELVAIAIVALGIVLSVLYPARRAMHIEPAIAIKDE